MVKLIFLCRRRPGLTRAAYARMVLEEHAPLALEHHTTMRRYEINVAEGTPDGGPELDSLPALCFDSLSDFRERLYGTPEGAEIVHRDVERFMGGADGYATTEHVQRDAERGAPLGARTPGRKWMLLLRRRPELSHEQFADHWLRVHAPLVLEHFPGLLRYVTNVVDERVSESGGDWDGVAELRFASGREAAGTPQGRAAVEEDTARFVARALAYPVAEYVQK